MKKKTKRYTVSIPAEMSAALSQLKQGQYKDASWNQLFRDLMEKGLTQVEQIRGEEKKTACQLTADAESGGVSTDKK